MYQIKIFSEALDDIYEICLYLKEFYDSSPNRFLNSLYASFENLKEFPLMYKHYEADSYFRKYTVMHYVVYYHVDPEKKTVEIHQVFHEKKNIRELLRKK